MIEKIAVAVFGGLVENQLHYFGGLDKSLKKGMFKLSLLEYVSIILLFSTIIFISAFFSGAFLISLRLAGLGDPNTVLYSYTSALIVSIIISGAFFLGGYYYPSVRAHSIKTQIERNLPFTVFYMATTSSSGIHPLDIFASLSRRKGPLGQEAGKIITNTKALGMNLTDAMAKVANRTASASFADLLWGMISVITTGGSIEDYLNMKTRSFMNQYRRSLESYAKQIAFYTEIYITLVLVGSLFFIVLTAIMSPLGGIDVLMLQSFVVFMVTPFVSVAFIVLLKGISPIE